jgi:outer membrane cobalamin receptor
MLFIIFIVLTSISSALSQERIETIEVIEQKAAIESSQEIDPTAIYFNSKKMVEALSYLPGLDVVDRTAPGIAPEVSMRGAPAQNVKVVVDEIDYDISMLGNIDLLLWDSWLYDSVKVSKSNTNEAFLFNSGGGAITLQAPTSSHFRFKTELGSFDLQKLSLSYGKEFDQQSLLFQLSLARSQNDFSFTNLNNTPQVVSDDFRDRRYNAGYEKGLIKSIYKIRQNKFLHQISFTKNRVEQQLPDINNSKFNRADLTTDYDIPAYTIRFKNRYNPEFTYFKLHKDEHFRDEAGSINLVAQDFSTNYKVDNFNFKSGIYSNDSFSLLTAIHLQEMQFSTIDHVAQKSSTFERQNSDFILKMKYFTNRFYAESLLGTLAVEDTEKTYRLDNFSQEFSFSMNKLWRISTQFSFGQKLGSLEQLYGNTGFLTGNSNLRPEEIRASSLTQHFTWSTGLVELSYFQHAYQDLLVVYFDARGVGKTQNADKSSARGWEFFAKYKMNSNWNIFSSITLQEVEYIEGSKIGNQLPGRYAEKYSYGLEFERKQSQIALDLQILKDIYLDSSNLLKARDYLSLNLNYKKSLAQDMYIHLSLNNITDEPNQLINGLPAFGQSFILSLEYSRI